MFFSVLVFSYPPFSLHNKSFYLMCSPEPRRQCEIRSSAIRNTLRTQTCIGFSHTFCGCLIVTSMSVSEWDPTQVSFRKCNHTDLSYFIFSVFLCVWATVWYQKWGEDVPVLYQHRANSAGLAFLQSTRKNLQNKVIIGKGKKKVASWLPICSSGSPRPISATLLFCWDKNTTVPPPNTLMPKSGCVRLGNSSDTLIPWNSCQHPLKCQHLQQGLMGCGHLSSTSCSRDSVIWRKNQSCDKT